MVAHQLPRSGDHLSIWSWKVLTAPVLIALVTMAGRRWGNAMSGALVGLPLTSGPISVLLAIEQGHRFAGAAAVGSLLGLTANVTSCLTYYAFLARRGPWLSATTAALAFVATAVLVSSMALGPGAATGLRVCTVAVGTALVRPAGATIRGATPVWDLPVRMVTAAAMVVAVTTAARSLGPFWSGILAPFPVFTLVLTTFAHRASGPAAAIGVLRGVVVGLSASLGFFVSVAYLVDRVPLWVSYGIAALVAMTASGFAIREAHRSGGNGRASGRATP